ncbi:DUF3786 domain-containing protein [Candidatus Magnetomoraceae bacterium gMMP-15]
MPRVDDYFNAKKIAVELLSNESFNAIARRSGFDISKAEHGNKKFHIPFLDRIYSVSFPEFEFSAKDEKEVPIQEQVLILHYMMGQDVPETGRWVAYREIKGASFYFSAFVKRAIDPLKKVFGQQKDLLIKTAKHLNGKKIDTGDAGLKFCPFPHVPIQIILWEEDEEFPAEANILFQDNIAEVLSAEDIAWMSGMVVYRLMALTRS